MTELAALFFGFLGGFAFLLLLLGLFGPRIGLFWTERGTRPRAALIYGGTIVVALALLIALRYEPKEARAWSERSDTILAQMQADYEAGRYAAVIDSARRYVDHAEAAPVEELHDRALEDSLEVPRHSDPAAEAKKNRDLYRRLVHFDAANERYVSKLIHYEVDYEAERGERSSRGVRNYYVEQAVKKSLEHPDRFEHVETRFADKGDRLYVTMRFRANGAPEVNTAYAIVSIEDQLTWLMIE